jgi:hypothetical protein
VHPQCATYHHPTRPTGPSTAPQSAPSTAYARQHAMLIMRGHPVHPGCNATQQEGGDQGLEPA